MRVATDRIAPRWPGPSRQRWKSSQAVAVSLDDGAHVFRHGAVGRHVEQDRAGVADQRVGPDGDDNSAEETNDGIIQAQPRSHPSTSPAMTISDTAASART